MVQTTLKPSRRARAYQRPRAANGRFKPERKLVRQQIDWTVLYQWRDARRDYAQQLEASKREERWGGIRSISILTAMSTVLVGMLIAGTLGGV